MLILIGATTAGLDKAMGSARRSVGSLSGEAEKTSRKTRGVFAKMGSGVGSLLKKAFTFTGLAGVLAAPGIALTKGFGRLTALENAQAKLKGLGHDAGTVESIMDNALKAVKGTAFGMDEAATTAAGAVAAGVKPGKDLESVLTLVGDAATIAGTDMSSMGAIFNKVATANKIQGDVIAQLSDQGIPIVQLLSKELGVSAEETVKLASAGKINFETFRKAMESGVGGAAQESGATTEGAFKNMMAALGRVGANLLTGIFPYFAKTFSGITGLLEPIEEKATQLGDAFGRGLGFAADAVRLFVGTIQGTGADVDIPFMNQIIDAGALVATAIDKVRSAFAKLAPQLQGGVLGGLAQVSPLFAAVAGALPPILSALPQITGAFGQVGAAVGNLVAQVLPTLLSIIGEMAPSLAGIVGAVAGLAAGLASLAPPILSAVAGFIQFVTPVLQSKLLMEALVVVFGTIGGVMLALQVRTLAMTAAFATYTAITKAIRVASLAWVGVQWLLNAALSANPIGIVVLAIAALVAGIILAWRNSETFRNVVTTVFNAVKNVVTIVVSALVAAFNSIVAWFQRIISTAHQLNLRIIRTFLQIRDGVIRNIRNMVGTVIATVSSWVNRLVSFVVNLRDRFVRANQLLRDLAVRAFVQLRDRVVNTILGLVSRTMGAVLGLRDRVFGAFRSLRDGAANIINSVRERVLSIFVSLTNRAATVIGNARSRIVSIFSSLADRVRTLATRARDWALKPFVALRDRAGTIFRALRDSVGRAMGGLLDKIKGPLRTAFSWLNSNLIKPLNSVTSKFGLNIPDLPKFHKGGAIPGRGEMPIMALGGEGMLNRSAMARIGGKRGLDALNNGRGHFGGPGDWLKNFSEFISKPTELLARMATEGVKWAVSQVLGAIPAIPQTGVPLIDGLPKLFNSMKAGAASWAGKQQVQQEAELGAIGSSGPIGKGPWVKPVGAGIGTGYLGYPGHYGVDFPVGMNTPVHAVSNGVITKAALLTYSYGRHLMMRHADGLVTLYAHLNRLNASVGQSVKTGQVIGYSGTSGNSTGPHLHYETRVGGGYPGPNPRGVMRARGVTLDTGGMLQPGLTLVRNATGRPEPVLNPSQWDAIKNGGGNQPVVINIYGAVDKAAAAREIKQLLEGDARRSGGVKIMRGSGRG